MSRWKLLRMWVCVWDWFFWDIKEKFFTGLGFFWKSREGLRWTLIEISRIKYSASFSKTFFSLNFKPSPLKRKIFKASQQNCLPRSASNNKRNLFYVFTGYGTIAPRTTLGRVVTLAYALLGIPLTLIYLSSTGGVLARVARGVFSR